MTKEELKVMRLEAGISTAKASRQVHIAQRSWLRYESGERPIPESIVELFCIKNGLKYTPE